jgi:hypothetical protein
MTVIRLIEPLLSVLEPLTSPFLALLVLVSLLFIGRIQTGWRRAAFLVVTIVVFLFAYELSARNQEIQRWFRPLNSAIFTVYLFVILPAMLLPRNRWYRVFLLVPAALLVLTVLAVFDAYRTVPINERGFYWFLIRPAYLIAGLASCLVLLQPVLTLRSFRRVVRLIFLLVLLFGGFAFRQNYEDYRSMVERRRDAKPGLMSLSETSPVMQNGNAKTYLPSAVCRFSADGGYVQGCNMELFQRIL